MQRKIVFTSTAESHLQSIQSHSDLGLRKQVFKTLAYLETNPNHPSLRSHEYKSIKGHNGEKIFESYVQNNTPGAYRIFWHYGPDRVAANKRTAVITIVAIVSHP